LLINPQILLVKQKLNVDNVKNSSRRHWIRLRQMT
jgi:hypothetical protein